MRGNAVPAAALAVAAALALAAPCARAEDARRDEPPTITVQGTGKVKSRPDLARLSAAVETRASSLAAVSREHAPRASKAKAVLEGLAGNGARIREGAFSVAIERQPWIDGDGRRKAPDPVAVATTRFEVEVAPTDGIDAVLSALAESGLFEVRGVSYDVADRNAHLDAARRAAMADAIRQARLYAEAGGFRLGRLQLVRDGQASILERPVPMMAMREAGSEGSVQASAPDAIDADASVSVTWRILEGESPAAP
jgi:uncharacterized protein YggE